GPVDLLGRRDRKWDRRESTLSHFWPHHVPFLAASLSRLPDGSCRSALRSGTGSDKVRAYVSSPIRLIRSAFDAGIPARLLAADGAAPCPGELSCPCPSRCSLRAAWPRSANGST